MKETSKYLPQIIDIVGCYPNGIKTGAIGRILGVSINVIYSAIASSSMFAEDDDDKLFLVSPYKPKILQVLLFGGVISIEKTISIKKMYRKKQRHYSFIKGQMWLFKEMTEYNTGESKNMTRYNKIQIMDRRQ